MALSRAADRFADFGRWWHCREMLASRKMLAMLLIAMATMGCPVALGHPPSTADAHMPTAPESSCKCEFNKLHNGWCEACKKGYVAGILVPSAMLLEALDAHGHDFDPASIKCKTCQEAIKTQGFCDRDNMGFIHNLAYVSRLTYHLAKGTPMDVSKLTCKKCRQFARKHGWCEACHRGMAGNVVFTNRNDFEQAARQIDFLMSVIKMIDRCEMCAVARFTGGKCPKCNILYERDQPEHDQPRKSPP